MSDTDTLESEDHFGWWSLRQFTYESLRLTNFLSYKSAELRLGDFVALVGPNASGKSNAIAALKLLCDIPTHGLPLAINRRGGFDQLRHRSLGRPNDPGLRITFRLGTAPLSFYELKLRAIPGKRYAVKSESAEVWTGDRTKYSFLSDGTTLRWPDTVTDPKTGIKEAKELQTQIAPGQSALNSGMMAGFLVADALRSIQTVEISPAHVGALQDPTSTHDFEPDGSNTASVYDGLDVDSRSRLLEALNAVIGGIEDIDVLRYADKMTLQFTQTLSNGAMRKFHAKQMSDGTLRAFGILLATVRQPTPQLLVIEEPEIAVHLGALRVLVEILQAQNRNQVVITTHSADVVDMLPLSHVRVVWAENGESRIAEVSAHTHDTVLSGLITPGELLRTNALDPQTP